MTTPPSENQASGGVLRRLAGGLALLTVVAAAVEGGVRLDDWARWRTPFWSGIGSMADLAVRDATGMHPRPGAQFNKWQINQVGTRGPELNDSYRDRRVVVLGASETFGQAEKPGQEYPRQLQDSLSADNCGADVLNAAFPGMSLPTVEHDVRLRLATLRPAIVIYYPTPQQYLDEELPKPAVPDSTNSNTTAASRFNSRFLPRVRNQLKGMLPVALQNLLRERDIRAARNGHPADWLFAVAPEDRLEAFDQDLRRLVGTVHGVGAKMVLMTHANAFLGTPPKPPETLTAWVRFYPRSTGPTLLEFDSLAAVRIAGVAADSGIALVDPWRSFHAVDATHAFADFSHFTDQGAARMVSLLKEPTKKLLGCKAPPQ